MLNLFLRKILIFVFVKLKALMVVLYTEFSWELCPGLWRVKAIGSHRSCINLGSTSSEIDLEQVS